MNSRERSANPERRYGPLARLFIGAMALSLALGAVGAFLSGDWLATLALLALAIACVYSAVTGADSIAEQEPGTGLTACACCGGLTLLESRPDQACSTCEWETGPRADDLGYSLAQARDNYERYGVFYRPGDEDAWGGRAVG